MREKQGKKINRDRVCVVLWLVYACIKTVRWVHSLLTWLHWCDLTAHAVCTMIKSSQGGAAA